MALRLIGGGRGRGAKPEPDPAAPPPEPKQPEQAGPPPAAARTAGGRADGADGTAAAMRPAARADRPADASPVTPAARPAIRPARRTAPAGEPGRTVIGPHLSVTGTMRGADDIVIRGAVTGDIHGRTVEIRNGARVVGDVVAAEVTIGGAVKGNVEAATIVIRRGGGVEGRLENDGTCEISGAVEGDINSRDVTIAVGAEVNAVVTADKARVAGTVSGLIEAAETRIEETARIHGDIDCEGLVDIAGVVEGEVKGRRVIIREGASVAEAIFAEEVNIAGTVTGEVMAVAVSIAGTAYVDGQIIHHQIEIEPGAVVKGSRPWRPKQYLQRRDKPEPAQSAE